MLPACGLCRLTCPPGWTASCTPAMGRRSELAREGRCRLQNSSSSSELSSPPSTSKSPSSFSFSRCSFRSLMSVERVLAFSTRAALSQSELSSHICTAVCPCKSSSVERMPPPYAMMAPSAYAFWNSYAHQARPLPSEARDETACSLLSSSRSIASLLLSFTASHSELRSGVSWNSTSSCPYTMAQRVIESTDLTCHIPAWGLAARRRGPVRGRYYCRRIPPPHAWAT
mmetsp:Transcript_17258/g.47619  ORF Transcript_17258/g.47619 Transcript_17258/m.47619 type:complete len:228 (+) Transcript_17258:26-709(+)